MTLRVCTYSRFSSELQNEVSIEDQQRICNLRAKSEGWKIVKNYSDAAISGSSLIQRYGMQNLLMDALAGKFDIVLSEALDRLSRNLHDISGIYKQLEFAGVKIVTLSEGEINTMHIGLKGTMNELFLKDLADKTRRGLRGRVEKKKFPGGLSYGYRVKKQFDINGEAIKGDREIQNNQASIVQRIFREYANENKSPKAIAAQLNVENIPCPSGKTWGQSTINGNRKRGTGILNNVLYIGQLVWGKTRFIKTLAGKRVPRPVPENEWIKKELPDLRIISQELWDAAKSKQKKLDDKSGYLGTKRRPKYLLSGLLKCGSCGGGFPKHNSERYGCSNARNKGDSVCTNRKTIKKETIEKVVLEALQSQLMREDLIDVFCKEYIRHSNELRSSRNSCVKIYKSEQLKLVKEKENIVQAIKDGVPASILKEELEKITNRQSELENMLIESNDNEQPILHPSMAQYYKRSVRSLHATLTSNEASSEAQQHVRALIEKIVLTPVEGQEEFSIDLHGDLAGILNIATEGDNLNKNNNILLNINNLLQKSAPLAVSPCYHIRQRLVR